MLDATNVWNVFWYEKNLQGDIVAVYNDAGTKLVTYYYDAFGYCIASYDNNGSSTRAYYNPHYFRQSAGKAPIKTNINNLVDNPADDFVIHGPKNGRISEHINSISQTGNYGEIYASKLPNGMYQLANGHHRISALKQLGYKYVNFFLVK